MKVPVSWLRDYVPLDMPLGELAERLAVASCEVDRIVPRGLSTDGDNLGRFCVGRVLEVEKHPNADRLRVCQVDIGGGDARQIVCGAWNFEAGATVAVGLPGAWLPVLDAALDERELRGVRSHGMILAEDEVGLGADHDGIMTLPDGVEPGTPLADVLPIADDVLEIETTFNRPDLTSIYGIAREVAALYELELGPPPGEEPARHAIELVELRIDDTEGCPRYIGRLFRDVVVQTSPMWLRARLHAAGLRPVSNVVDVTNYAMLALGQPLHAFDADTLRGGVIVVRRAEAGEELRTLDGTLRQLVQSDLLIADDERGIALAGVMGGAETEVGDTTTSVLLEAASFDPLSVLRTSERLHLRSEASNRFEKGVDPHAAGDAAVLATQLLCEVAGATWTGAADAHVKLPERPVVRLRPQRVAGLTGLALAEDLQRARLTRLGFEIGEDWVVTVPTWRARDVIREADLVEEIARFHLADVEGTLPVRSEMTGLLSRAQRLRRRVEDVLVGAGLSEAYTSSLVTREQSPEGIGLLEPLSSEQAVLRTTMLDGLVAAARVNVDAGTHPVRLFEIARLYRPTGEELPEEHWHAAALVEGGFSEARRAVEGLYAALGCELHVERSSHSHLHPGKAAETDAGWLGELHPSLLEGVWGAFELDLETLFAPIPERVLYEDVITYPANRQDIAIAVAEEVEAGALVAAAHKAAGPELRAASVFDVYRGEQVGEGRKSVALHLVFQSPERTISDDEAGAMRGRVVAMLVERFGAELRG